MLRAGSTENLAPRAVQRLIERTPMSETINCGEHGKQQTTFVCQHLKNSLKTRERIGFFWAGGKRGDAWCSQCEEVRIREGGESGDWNELSEAHAQISILCGACYDRVRNLQGF